MSEADVVNALQRCIKDIRTWMIVDKLKLNDEKTELIVIGSRLQHARLILIELKIGQVRVTTVTSAKNLGTWFDGSCKMTVPCIDLPVGFYTTCITSDVSESS